MASGGAPIITFEDGWARIRTRGIDKLEAMIDHGMDNPKQSFKNKEYVELYTTVYTMCIQKAPHCYTEQLYEHFATSIKDYLQKVAYPALQAKTGPALIQELVRRWQDHRIMKKWLCDFFRYIDRFYVKRQSAKPLAMVCIERFYTLVFAPIQVRATPAILALVKQDRGGEEVDRDLLRDVIEIYIEMGAIQQANLVVYTSEFETPFIAATEEYYALAVAEWVQNDSCPDFLCKAEQRFAAERRRLTRCDYSTTITGLRLFFLVFPTIRCSSEPLIAMTF